MIINFNTLRRSCLKMTHFPVCAALICIFVLAPRVADEVLAAAEAVERNERRRNSAGFAEVDGSAARWGASAAISERAELVMGTVARVAIFEGENKAAAFEAAFAVFRALDAAMSLYRPESEISRLNASGATHSQAVGADVLALLSRARALSIETDGAFDVTVLPLLRAFGAYPELSYLGAPEPRAVGFAGLDLDVGSRTVRFRRRGMGVDLGGVAKGFALDRARLALAGAGVARARLDLGGNLAFAGEGPGGEWRVAVRDPDTPAGVLGVLGVASDAAVATSSNYARDFSAEGWRVPSHVYDPRSWRPVRAPRAVSVWASDATIADALSTALLVLGPEGADAVLRREPEVGALFVEGKGRSRRVMLLGRKPSAWSAAEPSPIDEHLE